MQIEGFSHFLKAEKMKINQLLSLLEISLLFGVVLAASFMWTIAFEFNSLDAPLLVLRGRFTYDIWSCDRLFVTQTPFKFMATMGIVSLAFHVVRNAVVLFEFIEQRA
ncbi:hypothetical protein ACEQPO_13855 [Bacillus sp. SL00103]